MPTVILISYHFYPSIEIGARRVTALARYLAQQGVRVVVLSEFGGHAYARETEIWPGVVAIPIKQPKRLLIDSFLSLKRRTGVPVASSVGQTAPAPGKAAAVDRAAGTRKSLRSRLHAAFFKFVYFIDAYKKWAWLASRAAVEAGRKYDARLILSSGPPHSMLLAGTRAANRLRIPHVADLRDPWTDHIPPSPQSPRGFELAVLQRLERWVMRSSAAITSTGSSVARILSDRYPGIQPKVHVIRNGFDGAMSAAAATTNGQLSILFAGELYVKRNPFPLLSALESLLSRPEIDSSRVRLTFMGRCATYDDQQLADWLKGKRCQSAVTILPQMPADAVAQAIRESTVLLNLAQQQPLSVPAKTFEHLASGREILLICENSSETAQLVAGISGVVQVDPSDSSALEHALLDLYQRHVTQGRLTAPSADQVLQYARNAVNESFLSVMRPIARLG